MDEETLRRIDEVLAGFDGKETDISAAGRENTRTVNRVARIAPLRRLSGETTFRRNVSRYHVEEFGFDWRKQEARMRSVFPSPIVFVTCE